MGWGRETSASRPGKIYPSPGVSNHMFEPNNIKTAVFSKVSATCSTPSVSFLRCQIVQQIQFYQFWGFPGFVFSLYLPYLLVKLHPIRVPNLLMGTLISLGSLGPCEPIWSPGAWAHWAHGVHFPLTIRCPSPDLQTAGPVFDSKWFHNVLYYSILFHALPCYSIVFAVKISQLALVSVCSYELVRPQIGAHQDHHLRLFVVMLDEKHME